MTNPSAASVVAVRTKFGNAYVRQGFEQFDWSSLSLRGEDRARRGVYLISATDPATTAPQGRGPTYALSADSFPRGYDRHPGAVLEEHLRLAAHVNDLETFGRLPHYIAAVPLREQGGYSLLSRRDLRRTYRQCQEDWYEQYPQEEDPAAGMLGESLRALHENRVFHSTGFDIDHVLVAEEDFTSIPDDRRMSSYFLLNSNWNTRTRYLATVSADDLATLLENTVLADGLPLGEGLRARRLVAGEDTITAYRKRGDDYTFPHIRRAVDKALLTLRALER